MGNIHCTDVGKCENCENFLSNSISQFILPVNEHASSLL